MKNKLLAAFLLFTSANAVCQTGTIGDVNTFVVQNSGAIMDKENDVDGYFFYYMIDKLKKGKREYAIQILDKNLVEVAKKTYVDDKNTILMESRFNNNTMMFAMANWGKDKITLLSYDKQANQQATYDIPLENKEVRYYKLFQDAGTLNFLYAVPNRGFIFNKFEDNKKIGYTLKYYPTDGGKAWEYGSPEESKDILTINPIEVNENFLVALEASKPNLLSRKIKMTVKVLDINTGKLLFEREYSKSKNPRMVNNAFLNTDNSVVFMGEYFKEGDNIMSDQSQGLFTEVIDFSGKTIKENLISWSKDVAKVLKVKTGSYLKDKGYVYFHDIVKTQSNEYYAIGELYKKTASAVGIASAILSQGQSGNSVTQLTVTDAVVFSFDADFKLKSIKEFDKGKSRAPSLTDYGSPQLNAHALKAYGVFDYEYTQIDKVNDRFYACFIDYERLKGESNKLAFKTIIYDEGELTEDKIYLKSGNKVFRTLPAKVGNVLLVEYDKKKKEILLHMEKLNIK